MKERTFAAIIVAVLVLLTVLVAQQPAEGVQEVCPEQGKVESQIDGDIDDVILPAGTQVCIKGSTTVVVVVADGTSTLRELLGINKNVSHYTVLTQPTTTTVVETTTTTEPEVTTSTSQPTSTTTVPETSTSTTTPEATTSTVPAPVTTTTVPIPPVSLPYTGINTALAVVLAVACGLGGTLLVYTNRENDFTE